MFRKLIAAALLIAVLGVVAVFDVAVHRRDQAAHDVIFVLVISVGGALYRRAIERRRRQL